MNVIHYWTKKEGVDLERVDLKENLWKTDTQSDRLYVIRLYVVAKRKITQLPERLDWISTSMGMHLKTQEYFNSKGYNLNSERISISLLILV